MELISTYTVFLKNSNNKNRLSLKKYYLLLLIPNLRSYAAADERNDFTKVDGEKGAERNRRR